MSGPSGVSKVLADLVARRTGRDPASVLPTSRLAELGVDSIQAMELVVEVQRSFDVSVDGQDLVDMETLGDVVQYVERRLASR